MATDPRRLTHGDQLTTTSSGRQTWQKQKKTKKRQTPGHELIKNNSKPQTHAKTPDANLNNKSTATLQYNTTLECRHLICIFVSLRKKILVSVISDLNSTVSWQRRTSWT